MKILLKNQKLLLITLLSIFTISMTAQKIEVSGTVFDKKNNETLPGVAIMEKGTSNGVITDLDGIYSIKVNPNATLVFSYIGYSKLEYQVVNGVKYNAYMEEKNEMLDEVIVIGYGVQKKTDKTGAVAQIKAEELNEGVLTDPIQAMQGKVSGVSITKKGGDPNGGFSVKIRGASGLFSSTEPMYVVDGVLGVDPTTIASEDIESFNVLKDASSTAIYGSRGANGVIIITTKSGKGDIPKNSKFEFNTYYSIDKVAKKLDMLTGDQLRTFATDHDLNMLDNGANTDWQDEIFRTGASKSYNFAASGGNKFATYRASITHTDFTGVVIGSAKKRTIGRINLMQKGLNNRLTIKAHLSGTFENNNYVQYSGSGPNDIIYQALQRNPTDPVYDEAGELYEVQRDFNYYNPVALAEQIQNKREAKRLFGNVRADLEILKGLTGSVSMGYTQNDDQSFYFEPSYVRGNTTSGYGRRGYGDYNSKLIESTLTYKKMFGKHDITILGGHSWQEDIISGLWAQGHSPLSDFVKSYNLGVLNDITTGDIGSYKESNLLISFFARAIYNFNSKYFVTATLRNDGSTRFGENNERSMFPSVSFGWNILREPFMSKVNIFSQLKLRAGWGKSGNQEFGNYRDIMYVAAGGSSFNPETGESVIGFYRSHNSNPNLKWEENKEFNLGMDFGLFNNRLSGSIEYYNKLTYDLLAPYAVEVPPNVQPTTWGNAGKIKNSGVELNLQSFIIDKKDFDWKTILTFSHNSQKVVSLSDSTQGFNWSEGDKKKGWLSGRGLVGDQNWTQIVDEGYELGTFFMPEYAGLNADGKVLFHTAAGGYTQYVDLAERRVVGHALPDFEIGWSNFLTYKNFDFSVALRWVQGFDILNVTRMVFSNPVVLPSLNGLTEVLDEVNRGVNDAPKVNSYYLEDGSYVKVDNLTLGYNFKKGKIKGIERLRLYISSNNLYTLTKYSGLDPEISYSGLSFGLDQYNVYPKTKTFTFGINVGF